MARTDILKLAKAFVKASLSAPTAFSFGDKNYSYSELDEELRAEFKALAPDYGTYKINQIINFALIEQTIDDVLPDKVMEKYSQFAEIKTFAQGEKPIFTQKITNASRRRAKQFIGKLDLQASMRYSSLLDIAMKLLPILLVELHRFLDGLIDFADVLDFVMEGLDACIYKEIEAQFIGAITNIQPINFSLANGFSEQDMDGLLVIADAYGKAAIYCTFEFTAKMWPSDTKMSDAMKEQRWLDNGYIATYKNHQVVILPQSYDDENNTVKTINPSYAYIIPVGAEKLVKIAFEGGTIVDEYTNYDRSKEVQVYSKVGVGAIFSKAIYVYQDLDLHR